MLSKPIIISDWDGGLADSPYKGGRNQYAAIVGLDYDSYPGVLQIERPMAVVTGDSGGSPVVKGYVKWFVNINSNTTTTVYALDDDASDVTRILRSTNGGAAWSLFQIVGSADSPFNANGGIFWNNYFLFASDKHLGYYKSGGSPEWNPTWLSFVVDGDQGGVDIDWHPMIRALRDGSLYIGCARYVALLTVVSGKTFDPADSTTYSFTARALDIPAEFRIRSMAEVGDLLFLGCWKRVGTDDFSVAVIFPWNYVLRPQSHEGGLFKDKVRGIYALLNIDNTLYTFMNTWEEIFYFNGAQFVRLKQIPQMMSSHIGIISLSGSGAGSVKEHKNMPHFGEPNSTTYEVPGGVYRYGTPDRSKYPLSLNLPYPLSLGQSKDYQVIALGACDFGGRRLLASWNNETDGTYGIDRLNLDSRLATGAYFETLLMHIGTVQEKSKIEKFEIYLDGPLATGQVITLKYRRKASGSWTTIAEGANTVTFSFALHGAKSEIYIPFNVDRVVNIQFRCEFTTSGDTTPKLRTILIQ